VNPVLDNYRDALGRSEFLRYLLNSLLIATGTTIVALTIASFATFGFTRVQFAGRRLLLVFVILGQVVPLAAIALPIYQIASSLDLIDKLPFLVIAYLAITLPVAVWLMRGYMSSIPRELEEAAEVDGCSPLGAFIRIVIPLSGPGLAATAAYVFFLTWQEFLFVLIFTTRPENRTLSVGIMDFVGQYETSWGNLMAASVLMAIPVILIFLLIQKKLISGLTEGALK